MKAKITTIGEVFKKQLSIESYQRPYKWSSASALALLGDIASANDNKQINEYRIGTIILHKRSDGFFGIVDGQQRLTTLALLLKCLGRELNFISNIHFSNASFAAIRKNYQALASRINGGNNDKLADYILNCCSVLEITTDNQEEAFQFFDSQISRGKALEPHDLLKAFHLREMADTNDTHNTSSLVSTWESADSNELSKLFAWYLYPITRWIKGKDGYFYSSKKIGAFKGIHKSKMPYAVYCEQASRCFQLEFSFLAGRRFFKYCEYYLSLLKEVKEISSSLSKSLKRFGDSYTFELFECALLLFADRFGIQSITEPVQRILLKYAFIFRSSRQLVYRNGISKYALGKHLDVGKDFNVFERISEMKTPQEIYLLPLEDIDPSTSYLYKDGEAKPEYKKIISFIKGEN